MTDPNPDLQLIHDHTTAVREWLAAPAHERGYYWARIEAAWRDVRGAGLTGIASTAATNLLHFNGKLKGIK